jgi:anti-anti-sigma factor
MNLHIHPGTKQLEVRINHDIVSTKIDALNRIYPDLDQAFEKGQSHRQFVIDLQGCNMVDSAGLNFLISLHKHLKDKNCETAIRNANKNLVRTFTFSRLDRYIHII